MEAMLSICINSARILGCINWYPNPRKYSPKWYKNNAYKALVFVVHCVSFFLLIPVQSQLIEKGSNIVLGKIIVENGLFWATLYVSYLTIIYNSSKIDKLIRISNQLPIKKRELQKILRYHFLFSAVYLCLMICYYVMSVHSPHNAGQLMAIAAYFSNRLTVTAINFLLTTALQIMISQFININYCLQCLQKQTG